MRIGVDLDGVVAGFHYSYQKLLCSITGKNLFHPDDAQNPPTWHWPEYRGYTKAEVAQAWKHIQQSQNFWRDLLPLDGVYALDAHIHVLEDHHDVYYITSRVGATAKRQSEEWVRATFGYDHTMYAPTVIVTDHKGPVAKALRLDFHIDDKKGKHRGHLAGESEYQTLPPQLHP